MKIKIKKLSPIEGGLPARDMADHIPGQSQPRNFSIPVEYEVEGTLITDIKVGESVVVVRERRNGIPVAGLFQTTPVTEVTPDTFSTRNSKYSYFFLTPEPEKV